MQNIKILTLYKDPLKRDAVRDYLTAKGYIVIAAVSPQDAVDKVRTNSVELLLTDFSFAVNTQDMVYQEIKVLNPMILIIKLNVDSGFSGMKAEGEGDYDFEYCQKMLNTLEVLEQTRNLYYFRVH